jgi:hypothetical protein
MRKWRMRAFAAAVLIVSAASVHRTDADSWPAAQIKEVFSASRDWFVRVTPGASIGETVGFAGAPKGSYAHAEFYVRNGQQSVYISLNGKGSELIVEPETGHWQYCEWRQDKHQCRDSNIARVWGQYREPTLRK